MKRNVNRLYQEDLQILFYIKNKKLIFNVKTSIIVKIKNFFKKFGRNNKNY